MLFLHFSFEEHISNEWIRYNSYMHAHVQLDIKVLVIFSEWKALPSSAILCSVLWYFFFNSRYFSLCIWFIYQWLMGCSLVSGSRYEQFHREGKLLEVTTCLLWEFIKLVFRLKMLFPAFLWCVSFFLFTWIQGDDLDRAYDSISAFSSRRNNQEAVFGEEESIKGNLYHTCDSVFSVSCMKGNFVLS